MSIPAVSHYMTNQPKTIDHAATLADAHRVMRENNIRHLPVIDGDRLVGMVTQRDLYLLETITDVDVDDVCVEEAMSEHPFIVTGDTALDEVVEIMAAHRYGSVVVMGREGIEGIFTSTDACRVLAGLLQAHQVE